MAAWKQALKGGYIMEEEKKKKVSDESVEKPDKIEQEAPKEEQRKEQKEVTEPEKNKVEEEKGSEKEKPEKNSTKAETKEKPGGIEKANPESGGVAKDDDHHEEYHFNEDDLHHDDEHFEDLSKEELLEKIKEITSRPIESVREKAIQEIHKGFYHLVEEDKKKALEEFLKDGNAEEDFDFRSDNELVSHFEDYYRSYKDNKKQFHGNQDKLKEDNLAKKEELLERLRKMVEGEVENTSIKALREIEEAWRKAEPVVAIRARELWANFNALRDRFYDQRSILFELKDLDRKKNQELKEEIIEKAKELLSKESMLNAVSELKKLHEEYKHIGPVPKEIRTQLWQKFKEVSDQIHDRRREVSEEFKKVLDSNQERKEELISKLEQLKNFSSDRINEWNSKTKEVLGIQDQWKKVGPIPKQKARDTSREFWSNFKGFFRKKQEFFKEIDKIRNQNLEAKNKLCEEVEAIKDHEDWEAAAKTIKSLQRKWKEIGPVPRKKSDQVYERFKKACDDFFNRRRGLMEERSEEFNENFEKKKEISAKIKSLNALDEKNFPEVQEMVKEWMAIGFVQRDQIKISRDELKESLESLINTEKESADEKVENLKIRVESLLIQAGAGGHPRVLKGKIDKIRRQIQSLERDAENWKQNVELFSRSEGAKKLKEEVNEKIKLAEEKIRALKNKIKILGQ